MYEYKAKVVRIIDGDSIELDIDLGFDIVLSKQNVRLYGVDAPESRTRDLVEKEKGLRAKARVEELLASTNGNFILYSKGVGKYGRCLGEIKIERSVQDVINLNELLINEGLAVSYDGGKR